MARRTFDALSLAALVGKYVDLSRPVTQRDLADMPHGSKQEHVGGAGLVVVVRDIERQDGPVRRHGTAVMFDYGMGFDLWDGEPWTVMVTDPEFERERNDRAATR